MKSMVDLQWALIVLMATAGAASQSGLLEDGNDDDDCNAMEVDVDITYDADSL